MKELTSPEIAYLNRRWAPITPVLVFAILYIVARELTVNINMPYFLLIYLSASYSAWSWGKEIRNNQNL
jgi:hypothetical protein